MILNIKINMYRTFLLLDRIHNLIKYYQVIFNKKKKLKFIIFFKIKIIYNSIREMETKINNILEKKELSKNSVLTYKRNFDKIHKILGSPKSFVQYKNVENIKKEVNDKVKSDGSKKLVYISISVILKDVRGYKKYSKMYSQLSFDLTKKINDRLKENKLDKKQKEKVLTFNNLVNKVKEMHKNKDKSKKHYNDFMLSYLYVIPTFTPRNEYMKINVVYNKNDVNNSDNFILVENNQISFILQEYKTKKKYGTITYKYTKTQENIIREYLKYLNQPSILFNFNRQSLHSKMNKLLGTSNRFIRITKNDFYVKREDYKNKTFKDKEQFQIKNFQHSIYQGDTSYRKDDLNNN